MFWKKRVYLDAAAGSLGNPSSPHAEGRAAKKKLEDARVEIARLLECKADDVVFTSGATEANAITILGLAKPGAHFLYLPSAHASVVENMKRAAERGVEIEALPITEGKVDIEKLKTMLRSQTRLVSMDAVCGETGTIWNTREVANTLAEWSRHAPGEGLNWQSGRSASSRMHASGALLHVDASQAPFTEKLARSHYGADLLVFDGAKVGVPGAGTLIAHRTIPLAPLSGGGGQERGLRSGTQNVEALRKFAVALRAAAENREAFRARAAKRRAELLSAISSIPSLLVNESREQVPEILNISLPGRDTDYLVALLDEAGFAVSTKSACETDSAEGSRAVLTLFGDQARAAATLRISFGKGISAREVVRFARALAQATAFIDSARA